jgi:hypothetical protein
MSRPNAGADEFEMGQKGQARVERGAEIMEEGHFQNRMIRGGREGGLEKPREVGTASLLNRGFTEGNHLGFSKRDVDAISLTPELGVAHKVEELGSRVAKEAEIIHEEEDGNEDEEGGGGDNDVREPGLKETHKVRDVKTPKQRGKPTTLSEALKKGGEGIGWVVTMKDPNFDREMECTEVLPDNVRNAIVAEDEQQLLTKDARESQRDVPEEDVRGTAEGALAVEDVGDEGISGIEGLPSGLTGTLSRCKEITGGHLPLEFRQEAFLPEHAKDITKSNAPVVDRM